MGRILPTDFRKWGNDFTQIWRDANYAIYSTQGGFEAIKVQKYKLDKPEWNCFVGDEYYPSTGSWGLNAKTLTTLERAEEVIREWKRFRTPVVIGN